MDRSLTKIEKKKSISTRFDRARRSVESAEGDREPVDVVFLLDCSGSMSSLVEGKPAIDHLRKAVGPYLADVPVISFHSSVVHDEIVDPTGSTAMHLAFEECKRHYAPKRVVVVSDGCPDSKNLATISALALGCPVDILYIGQPNDFGEVFLRELSSSTGGRQLTTSTLVSGFGGLLAENLRLLVDSRPESGVIEL